MKVFPVIKPMENIAQLRFFAELRFAVMSKTGWVMALTSSEQQAESLANLYEGWSWIEVTVQDG